jgi:hypothetical protein
MFRVNQRNEPAALIAQRAPASFKNPMLPRDQTCRAPAYAVHSQLRLISTKSGMTHSIIIPPKKVKDLGK